MPQSPVVIDVGGNKFIVGAGMLRKTLSAAHASQATLSLRDSETGSAYQVPVGKTFQALSVAMYPSTNFHPTMRLIQSTAPDSTTGEIVKLQTVSLSATANRDRFFAVDLTFAENTYLTSVCNSSDSSAPGMIVVGIES